ncbi:MAG: hypothetical protein K2X29_05470 [Candidatus Obscuribacterales bacterium]|nr:hypothetical protein [Candidatus Obscuribacterales bacterium]
MNKWQDEKVLYDLWLENNRQYTEIIRLRRQVSFMAMKNDPTNCPKIEEEEETLFNCSSCNLPTTGWKMTVTQLTPFSQFANNFVMNLFMRSIAVSPISFGDFTLGGNPPFANTIWVANAQCEQNRINYLPFPITSPGSFKFRLACVGGSSLRLIVEYFFDGNAGCPNPNNNCCGTINRLLELSPTNITCNPVYFRYTTSFPDGASFRCEVTK